MQVSDERLHKERSFHNARFEGGDNREAQDKFYWAIDRGARDYLDTVRLLARRSNVLEYGCANGTMSEELAPVAKSVDAIDISDVAISNAIARGPPSTFGSTVWMQ